MSNEIRMNRRRFLGRGVAGAAGAGLCTSGLNCLGDDAAVVSSKHFRVEEIRRTTARIPFREIPARNMARELPHWEYAEVCEVKLASGQVGFGETLLYYTWGTTSDDAVRRSIGRNAVELMWDDRLGAGLQMALFDAAGRAAEVPIHRLLGSQIHRTTPLSWWNIDTSAEDMVAECQRALRLGYRAYKTKGRPWFDLWDQVESVAKALPDWFKLDMDFNDTLLDAERAIPILKQIDQFAQVGIYESPIPQSDVPGNRAIRQATRADIAMHYGTPPPMIALEKEVCDGFVIGGGASRVLRQGTVAALGDKPFWLQLVGTGITAAYSLHFAAVLSHATWPAVNCHQLFTEQMLTEPIELHEGEAKIPDRPGLGFELDRHALAQLKVAKPSRRPDPRRLVETSWPDGRKMYFASPNRVNFVLTAGQQGKIPYYERGVSTRLVPNDGSDNWRELHTKATKAPFLVD